MTLTRINGKIEIVQIVDKPENVKIVLESSEGIDKVYEMIQNEENFILVNAKEKISKLVVANPLSSKLENNELEIISVS